MVIILLLLYLLFGRVMAWSLSVTLALVMGRKSFSVWTLAMLLAVGFLEDVIHVRPLGGSALVLLSLAFSIWILEKSYKSMILWWSFGFGIVGEVALHLVERQPITLVSIVGQVATLMLLWWLRIRFEKPEGIYVGQ